jgi:hypothetical protein
MSENRTPYLTVADLYTSITDGDLATPEMRRDNRVRHAAKLCAETADALRSLMDDGTFERGNSRMWRAANECYGAEAELLAALEVT